jgi:hypothetical protein
MIRDMAPTTTTTTKTIKNETKETAKMKTSPSSPPSSSSEQSQQQKDAVAAEQQDDANANDKNNIPKEPIEYNPRWRGYLFIMMFSFINFISIGNVPETLRKSIWVLSMVFGTLTFILSIVILTQDRSQSKLLLIEQFHYMKKNNGTIEGCTLLFMVLWWIIGVGYITRPAGIAYMTNNIYYSSWFTLFACIYTLNSWSDSKDILSIEEIVSVSLTLKYWWIHFIGAFVTFVSCINLEVQLGRRGKLVSPQDSRNAIFGMCMGLTSLIVSSFFILIHYDFITFIEEGGWMELWLSLFQILIWTIALSVLTAVDGVAATTSGYNCIPELLNSNYMLNNRDYVLNDLKGVINCTTIKNGVAESCQLQRLMLGSNLYFACWCCMLSAIAIALKWKTAKALNFAQAQQQQQAAAEAAIEHEGPDDGYDDDDDDDH